MKKLYSLITALIITATAFAQAPQKMSYQAVIRDNANVLVASVPVGMRISVLQGSATGIPVYVETQTVNTNANGLVSLQIGNGTVLSGTFSAIDWGSGPYFIKTETDPAGGSSYSITGTSELLSVPYALFAATPTYTIGLYPELGGYVFYVTADGKHGLVSETQTQGNDKWYNTQNIISNPANHSTNGQKFTDWRLPTQYELDLMTPQLQMASYFITSSWSSTETDLGSGSYNFAYIQLGGAISKSGIFDIWAVRTF